MDNPIKKWRKGKGNKDKENNGSVEIISEQGEKIGELKFSFNHKKKRD